MAQPSLASPVFPIFVKTSLDTHLVIVVSHDDTILDFKRKLVTDHASCFAEFGEITVLAVKVRRKGVFYRLSESMKMREAFIGLKGSFFLYVDATDINDATKTIAARSLTDILAAKVEELQSGKVLITQHFHANDTELLGNGSAKNAHITGLIGLSNDQKLPSEDTQKSKEVTIVKNNLIPSFIQQPKENSDELEDRLTNSNVHMYSSLVTDAGESGNQNSLVCQNVSFQKMNECTQVSLASKLDHGQMNSDFSVDAKKKKKHKKMKEKISGDDFANTEEQVTGIEINEHDVHPENISKNELPLDVEAETECPFEELVDQPESSKVNIDCSEKKKCTLQIEKNYLGHDAEYSTRIAKIGSNEPETVDVNSLEAIVNRKRIQKKSKRKISVDVTEILPEAVVSNSTTKETNLKIIAEKEHRHLAHVHDNGNDATVVANDLKVDEEKHCSSPKNTMKTKRKHKHHQESHEPFCYVDEHPCKPEKITKKNSSNIEISKKESESRLLIGANVGFEDIDSGISLSKEVKKHRHKKKIDLGKEDTVASMNEKVATVIDHPQQSAPAPDCSAVRFDMVESAQNMSRESSIKAVMVCSSNMPHLEETLNTITGEFANSSNSVAASLLHEDARPISDKFGKDDAEGTGIKHDKSFSLDEAGKILADMKCEVSGVVKHKSKRQKKMKDPKNVAAHNENKGPLEKLLPSAHTSNAANNVQPDKENAQNLLSNDPSDASPGEPLHVDKRKSYSSKRKTSKMLTPHCNEILRSISVPENQYNHDSMGETIVHHDDQPLQLSSENVATMLTGSIDNCKPAHTENCEITPEVPPNTDGKGSRHGRKKAKTNPYSLKSVDADATHQFEHEVIPKLPCVDNKELQKKLDQDGDCRKTTYIEKKQLEHAKQIEVSEKNYRRNKRKTEKLEPSNTKLKQHKVTLSGKEPFAQEQTVVTFDSLANSEDTGSCRYHSKQVSGIQSATVQNEHGDCDSDGSGHRLDTAKKQETAMLPVAELCKPHLQLKAPNEGAAKSHVTPHSLGSPVPEVGKLDFMDVFLPSSDNQGHPSPLLETFDKEECDGKELKVKLNDTKFKKVLKLDSGRESAQYSLASGHERSLHINSTIGDIVEECRSVAECGNKVERIQEKSEIPPDKHLEKNKMTKSNQVLCKRIDATSHIVHPRIQAESNTKESANPAASNDSTKDNTVADHHRYRVAARKVPHGQKGNHTKEHNERLPFAKENVFNDDNSSSSESTFNIAASNGYHSGSFSSSESDMDLDNALSSQASAKITDFRVKVRKRIGEHRDNDIDMPGNVGGMLNLGAVLRNSSTYKKAKALASQGLDEDDSQNQPVEVVPETQPEGVAH